MDSEGQRGGGYREVVQVGAGEQEFVLKMKSPKSVLALGIFDYSYESTVKRVSDHQVIIILCLRVFVPLWWAGFLR